MAERQKWARQSHRKTARRPYSILLARTHSGAVRRNEGLCASPKRMGQDRMPPGYADASFNLRVRCQEPGELLMRWEMEGGWKERKKLQV